MLPSQPVVLYKRIRELDKIAFYVFMLLIFYSFIDLITYIPGVTFTPNYTQNIIHVVVLMCVVFNTTKPSGSIYALDPWVIPFCSVRSIRSRRGCAMTSVGPRHFSLLGSLLQ